MVNSLLGMPLCSSFLEFFTISSIQFTSQICNDYWFRNIRSMWNGQHAQWTESTTWGRLSLLSLILLLRLFYRQYIQYRRFQILIDKNSEPAYVFPPPHSPESILLHICHVHLGWGVLVILVKGDITCLYTLLLPCSRSLHDTVHRVYISTDNSKRACWTDRRPCRPPLQPLQSFHYFAEMWPVLQDQR